ncbi:MAG: hypothetical protein PHO08_17105, partial [Methylococcales bacterium]|nr:hypothetical protein [Methylococcales bacterium]
INFAGKLWQVFRAVICGALDSLKTILGDAVTMVMDAIDVHIEFVGRMPTGDPPIKQQCLYQRRNHRTNAGEIMRAFISPHGGTRDRLFIIRRNAYRLPPYAGCRG